MATQWRINMSANGGAVELALSRLSFHATVQGVDLLQTASSVVASSTLVTREVTRAYDLDDTTEWNANDATKPQQITVTFGSDVPSLAEVRITGSSNNVLKSPTAFTVEYYNGSTWIVSWTVAATGAWYAYEQKIFRNPANASDAVPSPLYWQLRFTGLNGATDYALDEVYMKTTTGGADIAAGALAQTAQSALNGFGSVYDAPKAFDRSASFFWHSAVVNGAPQWIRTQYGSAVPYLARVQVTSCSGRQTQAPTGFVVEGSANGLFFDPAWTVTSIGTWSSGGETKTFDNPNAASSGASPRRTLRLGFGLGF